MSESLTGKVTPSRTVPEQHELSLPDSSFVTRGIQSKLKSENGSNFTDVIVITSDKKKTPAVRILLSMNSPFFDSLFTAGFLEQRNLEVSVSVKSHLLREILDFIYTDDCSLLRKVRKKATESSHITCHEVEALVRLIEAADYTCMERLVYRCEQAVTFAVENWPHTACTVVQAADNGRLSWGTMIHGNAVRKARKNLIQSLAEQYGGCNLKCGLLHLTTQGAMDVFRIVKDEKLHRRDMFQALILWATEADVVALQSKRPDWAETNIFIDVERITISIGRLKAANEIAQWFHIPGFEPSFLSNVVERSGLVSADTLCAAYKHQAIHLEKKAQAISEEVVALKERSMNLEWQGRR